MKCIKYYRTAKKPGAEIVRVTDEEAHKIVASGAANYCSKSEWKKKVRDAS